MPRKVDVEQTISTLVYGDLIQIKWLDAARCSPVKQHQLTNKVYATYKWSRGKFWCIRYDKLYRQPYLIVIVNEADYMIESIPVKTIVGIQILKIGKRFKIVGEVGDVFLGGGRIPYLVEPEGVGHIDEEA